ncbi:MAG: helicase-associated domain-containing protein, partial [Deinococcota bacterium]
HFPRDVQRASRRRAQRHCAFCRARKKPERMHTYRITPLSLWNAASAGLVSQVMVEALEYYAKFSVPANVITDIRELVGW